MRNRRYGRFFVDREFLGQPIMWCVSSQVIILDARANFVSDGIEYMGWSYHFRELAEGEIVPTYSVVVNDESFGFFRFVEVKSAD